MTLRQVTEADRPSLNAVVEHDGGYGIYKELRKVGGNVCCILIDPKVSGYSDPSVSGRKYAVQIERCYWRPGFLDSVGTQPIAIPAAASVVTQPWITPGKPEWWQEFEGRLIEATTMGQLLEAKSKLSASRRSTVMDVWQCDGRYGWLELKAARLRGEAEGNEQGGLL